LNTVYLSIGSNLGNRSKAIETARDFIVIYIGDIKASSLVYESESWGHQAPNYLNQCIEVQTAIAPNELLDIIKGIEADMGREQRQGPGYASRTIDIDILLYGEEVIKTRGLTIPHTKMHERLFVLRPLQEIASTLIHPVLEKSIKELLNSCSDDSQISRYI